MNQKSEMNFNFRDLFRAIRMGWSGKKMWVSFCGIILAYIGYLVLSYVALFLNGMSFLQIWQEFNLYPRIPATCFAWYSWIVYILGILMAICLYMLTALAVSKIAFQQLKGDEFYSIGDSRKFLAKHWKAFLFSSLLVLVMFVFFILSGIVIGGIARIPYVGELGFALCLIPIFFVSLFTVFIGLVFVVSLDLSPVIVGTTGEDTLETVIQLFSTVWSQPWRLVLYELLLSILLGISTFVLTSFTYFSLLLINASCGLLMGEKFNQIAEIALKFLPLKCPAFRLDLIFGGPVLAITAGSVSYNYTVLLAGIIGGITLLLIVGFVLSYSVATNISGQTLIYVILRQKKDKANLLEAEEEKEEEQVTVPAEEPKPASETVADETLSEEAKPTEKTDEPQTEEPKTE